MSKSNRTESALVKLIEEGGHVVLSTEAGYRRFVALERQYADELRHISTVDTDPELPHVEAEAELRHKHHAVLTAIREWEAKH